MTSLIFIYVEHHRLFCSRHYRNISIVGLVVDIDLLFLISTTWDFGNTSISDLNTVVCGIGSDVEFSIVFVFLLLLLQVVSIVASRTLSLISQRCAISFGKEYIFIFLNLVVEDEGEALGVGLYL